MIESDWTGATSKHMVFYVVMNQRSEREYPETRFEYTGVPMHIIDSDEDRK